MTRRPNQERSFGYSVGIVCALLAGFQVWRARPLAASVFSVLAIVLIAAAWLRPMLLRWPSAWWWTMAHALGWFNARVLLSVMFYIILTPLGILLRFVRWDPLCVRSPRRSSGWVPYPEGHRSPKHYERLY
ncbi:MAG: hypothetical protein HY737_00875 [Candidatus Omnitrophica bacterium]|nr:hypothetical protein [Candidatus Omnitrophota bacterium]